MRLSGWVMIGMLCFGAFLGAITPPDGVIIPGVRMGYITAQTTEAELSAILGKDQLRAIEIHVGEGETIPGTAVMPEDSLYALSIVWKNTKPNRNPQAVIISGNKSKWKTAEGITLGTTLKELESYNGAPFHLMGFEWDYQGTVTDCGNGTLTYLGLETENQENSSATMSLTMVPTEQSYQCVPPEVATSVKGDKLFSSAYPGMQALNPVVTEMVILFP